MVTLISKQKLFELKLVLYLLNSLNQFEMKIKVFRLKSNKLASYNLAHSNY